MNCVNNGKDVEGGSSQVKRCIFIMLVLWIILIQTLKIKKCLITYYKTYGIICLQKKCGYTSCHNCNFFWRGYQ
jgi:hypothetical protein